MNFMRIINEIRLMICIYSEGNKIKQDFFSICLLVYLASFLGLFFHSLSSANFFEILEVLSFNINTFFNSLKDFNAEYPIAILKLPNISFYEIVIFPLLMTLIYTFFPLVIIKVNELLKISKVMSIIIVMITIITINSLIFQISFFAIFLTFIMVINIVIFFPLGNGMYFAFFEYCVFLGDVLGSRKTVVNNKHLSIKIIIAIFLYLGYILLLSFYFLEVSLYIATIIYIAFIIILFINSSSNFLNKIIKKILAYSLIIILTILNIDNFNNNIVETLFSIVTVFFSFERVISSLYDLRKEISDLSLLYILEKKGDDYNWLINNKIIINSNCKLDSFSESELVKQIMIFTFLKDENVKKLIDFYREKFDTNLKFVLQLNYNVRFDNFENNLSIIEYLDNISKLPDSNLDLLSFRFDYAYLLFLETNRYDDIILLLEDIILLINDDNILYILYYALTKSGKIKFADNIKNKISNFENIKVEMESKLVNIE